MKKTAFYCSFLLANFMFSQDLSLKKGDLFDAGHLVTAIDSNENFVWIGTDNGLYRINKKIGRTKFYSLSVTGSPVNYISDLYCLDDGCMWIATNHGLVKYDNYGFITYNTENSNLPENVVVKIKIRNNELLVSTEKHGVLRMHKNHFHPEDEMETVKSSTIMALH